MCKLDSLKYKTNLLSNKINSGILDASSAPVLKDAPSHQNVDNKPLQANFSSHEKWKTWNYMDKGDNWGDMCLKGLHQSPINLEGISNEKRMFMQPTDFEHISYTKHAFQNPHYNINFFYTEINYPEITVK